VPSTSSAVTPTDPGRDDDSTVPELVPSTSSAVPALASCSFADDLHQTLAERATQIRKRRAKAYLGQAVLAERVVKRTE